MLPGKIWRQAALANVANTFVSDEAQEDGYWAAYWGDFLDDYKRARLFLMQQVCHMFYAMVLMKFAAAALPSRAAQDSSMETPQLVDLGEEVGADRLSLSSWEGQMLYAKSLLNEALSNMKTRRFAESIRRMAA